MLSYKVTLLRRFEIGLIFSTSNSLTLHNKNNKPYKKMTKKSTFFSKKCHFFPHSFTYPSYSLSIVLEKTDMATSDNIRYI